VILLAVFWHGYLGNWKYMHTHTPVRGLPRWAGTRKVKPIWILLKQETVSGSGSAGPHASAPRCRQITMPAPHHSFFTGRMPFLVPNQQRQSTEGLESTCMLHKQPFILIPKHSLLEQTSGGKIYRTHRTTSYSRLTYSHQNRRRQSWLTIIIITSW